MCVCVHCRDTSVRNWSTRIWKKPSFFPRRTDSNPVAPYMIQFYKELRRVCSIRQPVTCACVAPGEVSLNGTPLDWLLAMQTDEQGLPQLRHSLFLKEMKQINPKLAEGFLVVDGLYELVCRRVPWSVEHNTALKTELRGSPSEMFTMNTSGSLLLHKYWQRPDDPQELSQYLTVGCSFVQFLCETQGAEGVKAFLKQLDCSRPELQADSFRFKNKDLLHYEYKWKKYVEAEVNEKFRLSVCGMLRQLFAAYLLHHWCKLACVTLIILLDLAITLSFSIFSGQVFRQGFSEGNLAVIGKLAGILFALLVGRYLLLNTSGALLVSVAVQVSTEIRRQFVSRIQAVTPKFLMDHSTASILSTFSEDIGAVETFIAVSLKAFVKGILMLLTCLVFSLVVAWPIGVGLLVIFFSTQLVLNFISSMTAKVSFARSQALNKVSSMLKEALDGFTENRVFCSEYYWKILLEETLHRQYFPNTQRVLFLTEFVILSQQVVFIGICLFLIIGSGVLALYDIVAFEKGVTIFLFFSPTAVAVSTAASMFTQLQATRVGLGRISALLKNREHDIPNVSNVLPPVISLEDRQKGAEVEFYNVCHTYSPTASHWTLYNVSFTIAAGERVAIVGPSGCGKTSILNLVLQLYLPIEGKVLIAGRETNGRPSKLVAATFQSNHMFQMSVRENIRFGNLNASDEQVEKAAKQADIHNWIMSRPRRYDTILRNTSLSGGQRQRMAIARMLLANAPVLVVDEVTSALDPSTERRVFNTLMEVTRGRTVIAVTHRLDQAKQFDRIFVVSHGQVKETGTHCELMEQQGAYYHMVTKGCKEPSPHKPTPIFHRHSLTHLNRKLPIHNFSSSPVLMSSHFTSAVGTLPTPLHMLEEDKEESCSSSKITVVPNPLSLAKMVTTKIQFASEELPMPRTSTPLTDVELGLKPK